MKAICPKNQKHNQFVTTAHVMQEWIVDEKGEFIDINEGGECLEVTANPDPDNIWNCKTCGAIAKIEKD